MSAEDSKPHEDAEKDDVKIERAILDEVMRLYQEVVDGKIELQSGEEVFAELYADLENLR